jgi:exodeoxyribonuclease VII small subunit
MSKTAHSKPADAAAADSESFSASLEELMEIVRRIEDEQTDIDELGAALARASELLERCRSKIRRVDLEVSQIVQRLEGGSSAADGAADDRGDPPTGDPPTGDPPADDTGAADG